jgi:hypothetical protein
MGRCTQMASSWCPLQPARRRAGESRPQEKGGCGGEAPEVSASPAFLVAHYEPTPGEAEEGASICINRVQATASSLRFASASRRA